MQKEIDENLIKIHSNSKEIKVKLFLVSFKILI
jgi:hypothetical protein